MFWLVFWILVCVAILAYGIRRMANHDYFKSSDSNLDEKDEFVDKDYYDKKNLFK